MRQRRSGPRVADRPTAEVDHLHLNDQKQSVEERGMLWPP
jgi:hypothetical protein